MPGFKKRQPDKRMFQGEIVGNLGGHHGIFGSMQDQCLLMEIWRRFVLGRVLQKLIPQALLGLGAIVEYRDRTLALPLLDFLSAQALPPALQKFKRWSEQNQIGRASCRERV